MKDFFINNIISFYQFGMKTKKNRSIIFLILLSIWALAFYSFSKIELNNSSAMLLPDSSHKLQKMAQGMDLAPFSRLFFVDIYHPNANKDELEISARKIIEVINPKHAILLKENANVAPKNIMQFLPNFFTEDIENQLISDLNSQVLEARANDTLQTLSTFAVSSIVPWLRADPFNLKSIILDNFPTPLEEKSNNTKGKEENAQNNFFNLNAEYQYSKDNKHLLLTFQPLVSIHDTTVARALIENIRNLKPSLPSTIEINMAGGIVHTAENTITIENDIKNIVFFSLIGLLLLYIFFVRSLSGIWLLLTPAFAVSLSLGFMTAFSASLSGLALGFGAAVLGIAEDYAVHMYCAMEKEKNTQKVLRFLSIPLFQGFILNISGFSVLLFSSLPAIRQLALFAILSLTFGFLLALFILPLCPRFKTFFAPKVKPIQKIVENKSEVLNQKPSFIRCAILSLFLIIATTYLFTHISVDVSPQSMGVALNKDDTNIQKFTETWANDTQSTASLYILESNNEEELFENARLISETMNNLSKKEAQSMQESSISTIAYLFPTISEQEENIARWKHFLQQYQAEIISTLEKSSALFSIPNTIFQPFFDILHSKPMLLTYDNISETPLAPLIDFYVLSKNSNLQEGEEIKFHTLLISNNSFNIENLEENIDQSILEKLIELSPKALEDEILSSFYDEAKYLPIALFVCTILLYLCYFDIAKTLLALTPALFSLFSVLLGMYIVQSPLTLGGLTALLLVIGLALDHGILVSAELENGLELNLKRALFISSMSTILGIGLLAFANHPTLRDMGRIILFGLILEVPVSLYLLPLLCKKENHAN